MPHEAHKKLQNPLPGTSEAPPEGKGPGQAGHVGSRSPPPSPGGPAALIRHGKGNAAAIRPRGEPGQSSLCVHTQVPKQTPGANAARSQARAGVGTRPCPRAASALRGSQLSQQQHWGCWSQPDPGARSRKSVTNTGRSPKLPATSRSNRAQPPRSSEPRAGSPRQIRG